MKLLFIDFTYDELKLFGAFKKLQNESYSEGDFKSTNK